MFSTVCRSVALFTIIVLAAFLGWSMAEERKPRAKTAAAAGRTERIEPVRFTAWDDEVVDAVNGQTTASSPDANGSKAPKRHQINQLYVVGTPENGVAPLPELK